MTNNLMSDMQILTTTTMMPALEQKLFLGQEWEKLCKVEQHPTWDSRQSLESHLLGFIYWFCHLLAW